MDILLFYIGVFAMSDYVTSDFDYHLPAELIAQYPLTNRGDSRLLSVDVSTGSLNNQSFSNIAQYLQAGDLLVLNDTKVIPARLYGHKESGGRVELLIERMLSSHMALAHIKASKSPAPGGLIFLQKKVSHSKKADDLIEGDDLVNSISFSDGDDGHDKGHHNAQQADANDADSHLKLPLKVVAREGSLFKIEFPEEIMSTLRLAGYQPLPPYINRPPTEMDEARYQTVFAARHGAVAAPTAGLHFDEDLLAALKEKGVDIGHVTLHVGAGTFQPLRGENLEEQQLHKEYMEVDAALCEKIRDCKARAGKVVAVGTTVVRCLEEAARQAIFHKMDQHENDHHKIDGQSDCDWRSADASEEMVKPFTGDTQLFIYPPYRFKCVDAMVTNFHLPRSSLLMLVAAFSNLELLQKAYRHAIDEQYRFFSYGDAMLLHGGQRHTVKT